MAAQNSRGKRIVGRPFPKGNSANPGGRPKLAKGFADWCRDQFETPAGRALLEKRMKKSDFVLTKLLGYAYGEPKQQMQHSGDVTVRITHVNDWRTGDR